MRRTVAVVLLMSFLPATRVAQAQTTPPVVSNERPARFVLTGGTVVVGTKISEDAEYFVVQTASGVVRVRKRDIASIDFGAGPPAQAAPAASTPPAAPPPTAEENESSTGGKIFSASFGTFIGIYVLTAVTGAFIAIVDADANWMLVPGAGPLLYYRLGDLSEKSLGVLILCTVLQGGAILGMLVGGVMSGGSTDASNGLRIAEGVEIVPQISRTAGGLVVGVTL